VRRPPTLRQPTQDHDGRPVPMLLILPSPKAAVPPVGCDECYRRAVHLTATTHDGMPCATSQVRKVWHVECNCAAQSMRVAALAWRMHCSAWHGACNAERIAQCLTAVAAILAHRTVQVPRIAEAVCVCVRMCAGAGACVCALRCMCVQVPRIAKSVHPSVARAHQDRRSRSRWYRCTR
jgi:hypothetical protein